MSCWTRLFWDPKSKSLLWSVAFSLGAGPQSAWDNFASNPKISKKNTFLFYIYEGCTWKKTCSLVYLKTPLTRSKIALPILGAYNKIEKNLFFPKFSFWRFFFGVKWFFDNENLAMQKWYIFWFFGIEHIKI